MNETTSEDRQSEPAAPQTSDEKVWRSPGYQVVETALEVTGYALGDR
ncbi:MAG: pyrroloquinoline quinone precursor peptide PqqA [Streptomyces sp.]|nr:pyrroloquinoline quinone precursor peptide PqqA [Streptomyces sp.]MBW8794871.1 pyrroloquinoline quinone precursor peptide PqqA [Streptomyces sp.]